MSRLLLRYIVLITTLCALAIGVIHAQPNYDGDLRAFLLPPEGCATPCFMGIRPGVTTTQEAVERLQDSDWVSRIFDSTITQGGGYGQIRWNWTAKRPIWID